MARIYSFLFFVSMVFFIFSAKIALGGRPQLPFFHGLHPFLILMRLMFALLHSQHSRSPNLVFSPH